MNRGLLNGLDLFSGIGGNSIALAEWINTVAYCEQDRYAQAVLLSRMAEGVLPSRPIWDDVRTLRGDQLPRIDIIVGGFPCQDISVAGRGAGLEGQRSGLFYEIVRLAQETKSSFLFLENVPAIRTRGLDAVVRTLSGVGYDCRWGMLSAYDVGAPHVRERWFLLAYSRGYAELHARDEAETLESERVTRLVSLGSSPRQPESSAVPPLADGSGFGWSERRARSEVRSGRDDLASGSSDVANSNGSRESQCAEGRDGQGTGPLDGGEDVADSHEISGEERRALRERSADARVGCEWEPEPDVGRVVNGLPFRVDRIKCLGNAVVPAQAREAFKRLMGLT